MLDNINQIIEDEINNRVWNTLESLNATEEKLKETSNKLYEIKEENKRLQKIIDQHTAFITFKDLINTTNFESILTYFNLKSNGFSINGMDSEDIPMWFKLLFRYYEDKEKLFSLMDLFDVEYPEWAKNYKMPYDYNEEELLIFINPKYDRYITNGCIFDGNIGFFWRNIKNNKADTYRILTNKSSFSTYIPWQLILSNKLWTNGKMFNQITNALKNKQRDSYYYYHIQDYIDISPTQANEMAKYLPKEKLSDHHKKFITNNNNIIKNNLWLAEEFKDKMEDNQFSSFNYLKYPIDMQKEFIRNYKRTFYTKLELIKKMDLTKEEKVKFLIEIVEQEMD